MILWYIFPQKTFMRKQLFSDFVFWLFGAIKWYLCYLCVSGNSKSSKTTFFARILRLSMKGIILRNAQLFACFVNILKIFYLFLKVFSYFCKRIHLYIIMYGKERCKQIEDHVGSNQALKQVVGRNVG